MGHFDVEFPVHRNLARMETMTDRNERRPGSADKTVLDIRRATRRRFSAEEKIRIVLEGLRGEETIAELWCKEGINQNLYYRWSKDFLEAGKTAARRRCCAGSDLGRSQGSES